MIELVSRQTFIFKDNRVVCEKMEVVSSGNTSSISCLHYAKRWRHFLTRQPSVDGLFIELVWMYIIYLCIFLLVILKILVLLLMFFQKKRKKRKREMGGASPCELRHFVPAPPAWRASFMRSRKDLLLISTDRYGGKSMEPNDRPATLMTSSAVRDPPDRGCLCFNARVPPAERPESNQGLTLTGRSQPQRTEEKDDCETSSFCRLRHPDRVLFSFLPSVHWLLECPHKTGCNLKTFCFSIQPADTNTPLITTSWNSSSLFYWEFV